MRDTAKRDDLASRAVRSGSWAFFARISARLLAMVQVFVLARLLTPEQFGVIAIAFIALEFLKTFTDAGLDLALIQRSTSIDSHLDTAWSFKFLRSLALAVVLLVGGSTYANFFDEASAGGFVQAFALPVLLAGITNIGLVYFKKDVRYERLVVYEVVPALVNVAVTVAVAWATRSIWALWWGFTAKTITAVAISYAIHSYRPRFELVWRYVRDLFGFSKWIYLTSILLFLLNQGDDIAVGRLEGTAALGLYGVAFRIARLPVTEINATLAKVLFPAFSEIQHDLERLRKAYLSSLSVVALFTAPFCAGIFVVAPHAVPALLGDKWVDAVETTQVFALLGLLVSIGSTTTSVFRAIGRPDITTKAQVVRGIVMFALLFPMLDRWGIVGAAWAVVISEVTISGYLMFRLKVALQTSVTELLLSCATQFLAAACMAGVVWALPMLLSESQSVLVVAGLALVGAAVYLTCAVGFDRLFGGRLDALVRSRLKPSPDSA